MRLGLLYQQKTMLFIKKRIAIQRSYQITLGNQRDQDLRQALVRQPKKAY